jgi:predicted phosphodiesterase
MVRFFGPFRHLVHTLLISLFSPMSYTLGSKLIGRASSALTVTFSEIISSHERIKCYCVSDLHADSEKNQLWVKENCVRRDEDQGIFTVLILPGDVGSEIERLEQVFKTVVANYNAVVFVPGNHEAWRRGIAIGGSATIPDERAEERMAIDSTVKLREVLQRAKLNGVFVGPLRIQSLVSNNAQGAPSPVNPASSVVIFPLYSWYHSGWDAEPEISHPDYLGVEEALPFKRKWGDFSMCSWPDDLVSQEDFCSIDNDNTVLAKYFAAINEPFLSPMKTKPAVISTSEPFSEQHLRNRSDGAREAQNSNSESGSPLVLENDTIISFSHFLPRQELCPEKRFLLEPLLAKVVGSRFLENQIRRLKPHVHLFGHTHIPIDLELDSVRYVQWPKGYARYFNLKLEQC